MRLAVMVGAKRLHITKQVGEKQVIPKITSVIDVMQMEGIRRAALLAVPPLPDEAGQLPRGGMQINLAIPPLAEGHREEPV